MPADEPMSVHPSAGSTGTTSSSAAVHAQPALTRRVTDPQPLTAAQQPQTSHAVRLRGGARRYQASVLATRYA